MKPYFFDTYAVATSEFGYSMGTESKEELERARESIISKLEASSGEVIFTSGDTESNNTALKGEHGPLGQRKASILLSRR
jgi:cysteine desulfurase